MKQMKSMNKMTHTKFNLNNFLLSLSQSLDNAVPNNHFSTSYNSQRVSYIALKIASFNNFSQQNLSDILSFVLLQKHKFATENLSDFPFEDTEILKNEVFAEILLLSNEIEDNLKIQDNYIVNKNEIIQKMEDFEVCEELKENFFFLSEFDSFWLDLTNSVRLPFLILDMLCDTTLEISYEDLIRIVKIISRIIYEYCDFISLDFMEEALSKMCKLYNFDEKDTSRMILSGYLSNIGLLKIPQNILIKPYKLTTLEYEIIKSAPYHTKQILSAVFGFDDIATLSASVYEKLDGSGYPYKLEGSELGLKNRILSVVFMAKSLGEKRKYRKDFEKNDILNELERLANEGYSDISVVNDFRLICG